MKKIVIALCLLVSIGAKAQYDTLPYNIGIANYFMGYPLDSLHKSFHDEVWCYPQLSSICEVIFDHEHFDSSHFIPHVDLLTGDYLPYAIPGDNSPSGDLAFAFYPDSTVHIKGIAWYNILWESIDAMWANWDTLEVKLYIPTSADRMMPVLRKKIAHDTFSFNKFMDPYRGWSSNDYVVVPTDPVSLLAPFYEVYFDNEIDVADSFYVSVKYSHNVNENVFFNRSNWDYTIGWFEWHADTNSAHYNTITYVFPMQRYRKKYTSGDDDVWTCGEVPTYPLLFPIIRRDCDSCPEVHEVNFTKVGSSAAIVQWDEGANHNDWQICYGAPGFNPDDGQVIDTRVPRRALTGLSTTAHYDVYIKARCRFDQYTWSQWAGPFDLCLKEIGIDGVAAVETEIGPNPVHGTLTVRCAEAMTVVELYDVQGRCVLTHQVKSTEAVVDISALPQGHYTAVVRTAQGTATKQVVVL